MNKYLVSIVIPTKNRQYYCLAAVKQILSLNESKIQICVQDNSDSDFLGKELAALNTSNIVYHYHAGVLSFVDNFSEAISLASGNFVCMIGDDDGVLPNIIDAANYAQKHNLDGIIPGLNSVYFWPSPNPIRKGGEHGVLIINTIKDFKEKVNPQKAMVSLLKNGALDYASYDLPRVYHGLVKKCIFDRIVTRTGKLFDGLTPDIYMAGALSFMCTNVIRTQYPITVSGICPTSGSADSATGRHTGELKDAPHFRGHDHYNWEKSIPYIYSVETIWAETLLKVLHNFNKDALLQYFNVQKMTNTCYRKYPQFSERLESFAESQGFVIAKCNENKLLANVNKITSKMLKFLRYGKTNSCFFYNIKDIQDAAQKTSSFLL